MSTSSVDDGPQESVIKEVVDLKVVDLLWERGRLFGVGLCRVGSIAVQ